MQPKNDDLEESDTSNSDPIGYSHEFTPETLRTPVAMAIGERERARKIIDQLPESHPFEIRYTQVEKVPWETCKQVLDSRERTRLLSLGW